MIDLENGFMHIRPYLGENLGDIRKAAMTDRHVVLNPTQYVEKHGEIVGALDISSCVPVLVWMHTAKTKIQDSIEVMRFYENFVAGHSVPTHKTILLPCPLTSPFLKYLQNPKLGYASAGQCELFVKKV